MRKIILIIIAILLLCVTCKATALSEDKYELLLQLDDLIGQIRYNINAEKDENSLYENYFQIVDIKYEFLETCKSNTAKNYYEKNLDKCNTYIGNAICEKDERWLDEALSVLDDTFGDYKNHKTKYIK